MTWRVDKRDGTPPHWPKFFTSEDAALRCERAENGRKQGSAVAWRWEPVT